MIKERAEGLLTATFFDLSAFAHAGLFHGFHYPWEALLNLTSYLKKQKLGKIEVEIPEGVFLENAKAISIGAGTVIEPGAYIRGPCIIGARCQIRHGAYIRGDLVAGDECIIGHATEVKHSILLNKAIAAHFNYVGDSILGNGVNLGAGVVLANLRLDHAAVKVSYDGQKIETTLKKLGAIIGDNAQIGCNTVLNPGTLVGKNSLISPSLNISGYIPPFGKVKPTSKN
jgi:NDP-sugar pyrophosphorylase family protein